MDITPYVDSLRRDLVAAAEAGSDELKQAAERLTYALDPSARLALMEAISHAAAEITAELPDGSVDVRLGRPRARLRRRDRPAQPPCPPRPRRRHRPAPPEEDDGDLARITLRIPEAVKARAEEKAAAAGQSLNTWMVNVVRARHQRPRRSTSTSTSAASPSSATTRSPPTAGRAGQPPDDRLALTPDLHPAGHRPHHRTQRTGTGRPGGRTHPEETPMSNHLDRTFDTPEPIELYVENGSRHRRRDRHRHHRDRPSGSPASAPRSSTCERPRRPDRDHRARTAAAGFLGKDPRAEIVVEVPAASALTAKVGSSDVVDPRPVRRHPHRHRVRRRQPSTSSTATPSSSPGSGDLARRAPRRRRPDQVRLGRRPRRRADVRPGRHDRQRRRTRRVRRRRARRQDRLGRRPGRRCGRRGRSSPPAAATWSSTRPPRAASTAKTASGDVRIGVAPDPGVDRRPHRDRPPRLDLPSTGRARAPTSPTSRSGPPPPRATSPSTQS